MRADFNDFKSPNPAELQNYLSNFVEPLTDNRLEEDGHERMEVPRQDSNFDQSMSCSEKVQDL